jgi:hypothetical protein
MTLILNGTTGVSGVDGSAATPAFQGNDANTGISFGTDIVTINTGGVARVTTDASGNVGVGVTPSAWASNLTSLDLRSEGFISGGGSYMVLLSNTYFNSGAKYKTTGFNATQYLQQNGAHSWSTAPSGTAGNAITFTQAMTLDAAGVLSLNQGQIQFPVTQVASGNPNTLDDYEEGNWTPTSTTAGVTVTSVNTAVYIKIGRFVQAYAYFQITSTGTAGANWGGLPFPSLSYGPATRYYSNGGTTFTNSNYLEQNTTQFRDGGPLAAGSYGVMISATYMAQT